MLNRSLSTKQVAVNIVGSSTFGRYTKISTEKTYNMFLSDNFMVPYAGYKSVLMPDGIIRGTIGRGIHTSTKLNKLVIVLSSNVFLVDIQYDQITQEYTSIYSTFLGTLQTNTGIVYITENNKPQVVISDGLNIYVYDPNPPTGTKSFYIATKDGTAPIDFIPGYIDFHDTYILVAASSDGFYTPPANNTWRLSSFVTTGTNTGQLCFPDAAFNIGLLQTKPDNTQAVVRFPSKGNMIMVMGQTVGEPWYDTNYQLFPYSRSTSNSIDYGCLNPDTIASTDQMVCWLAGNEKSGPVIMFSDGVSFEKITTDGIDYLFSKMQNPSDSRAFMYRQDGHIFYHINFYTDNISLFYDFNTKKFYHASDENGNYFIADQVAFYNNQYYFITRNNGNLYAFDTIYTTYDGAYIPRWRICKNVRLPNQEYFVANDVGFTIEMGTTNYNQFPPPSDLLPKVLLSISTDGGYSFGSEVSISMNPIGIGKNKLQWWRLGIVNDLVCRFDFVGLGRFVCTDGIINIRQ